MGQVVDTPSAQEFMREAMQKIPLAELDAIEQELAGKSARFQSLLARENLAQLTSDNWRELLHLIFAVRRKTKDLLAASGEARLRESVRTLLYSSDEPAIRFETFCDQFAELEESIRYDLASELLHYTNPDEYWLWTRWMWDPRVGTGAVPLVVEELYDLHGRTAGETYMKVGVAVAFVRATGEAAGFARFGPGPFGVDVFLACVYAVYMYTTLRLRMTQEFNKVVPQLPELSRRLLGVWKLEL